MKYKLSEIGKVVGGGTPSTKHPEYYTGSGIPWLTPKDLSGYDKMYISKGGRDITQEGLENSSAKLLPANSVLVSSRAPIGYVAIAENEIATNQGFKSIIPNRELVIPEYLYFVMKTSKQDLEQIASGSTFKEVSTKVMSNFEVEIPDLDEQRKVLDYLLPITRKIEKNSRINDNLEALLTTIFNDHIEKNGFEEASLTDIATYKNGLAMQKYRPEDHEQSLPVLKIKELNQGHIDDSSDRCSAHIDENVIVHTGDIIFSWSGTLLVKNWSGGTAGLNQHLFKVTSKHYPDWFIYEWTKHHLRRFQSIASGKATTMGHIKKSDLKSSQVLIPNKNELGKLDAKMKPFYNQRIELIKENQRLADLKQTLLQKYF